MDKRVEISFVSKKEETTTGLNTFPQSWIQKACYFGRGFLLEWMKRLYCRKFA